MTEIHEKAYEIFRKTREQRGLSLSDTANALHLTVLVIEQIEAGQFSRSHLAPVFMRGYMRSYAKYLGLPQDVVDEIIKTLNVEAPIVPSTTEKLQVTHERLRPRRSVTKIFFYLIVVIALIIAASFWHNMKKMDVPLTKMASATDENNLTPPSTEVLPTALEENEDIVASEPEEDISAPAEEDVPTQTEEDPAAPPESTPTEPPEALATPAESTPLPPLVSVPTPAKKVLAPPAPTASDGVEIVDAQESR